MGYRCIAYTPWMAEILERDYGLEARWFECGTDLDTYTFAGEEGREPGHVAVYGRRETPRRAVELAIAGIANLFERRPGAARHAVRLAHQGQRAVPVRGPRRACRPRELAALYRAGERGRGVLLDHPLAGGPGDDGQRPAGGGARGRQRVVARSVPRASA